MALTSGVRLGPYQISAALGAGGMGEVYRARDTRLQRDVAIKVLPETFATDPEFRDRFEREARAVAALSHPNIVHIYELGADGGRHYAAMELLEGETLRERLTAGALPMRKVVDYALQIAYGLAAAHGRGIVHRDLKPENIFITRDGRVKILDFGLAKLTERAPVADVTGVTGASSGTVPGVVLGTVGYMSPEQVRAHPVDHRSDIFSFGAVLYEMLTGRRAFSGPSSVETLHAILNSDPVAPRDGTGAILPAGLERIVRHCLEKSPDERFHSAHDLAFALQALSSPGTDGAPAVRPRRARRWLAAAGAAALLVAATAATVWYVRPRPTAAPVVFNILPPADSAAGFPAVSPDGSQIAFLTPSGSWYTGDAIWIRRPDSAVPRKLEGTSGARTPFWSPDGRSIGFFSGGKLKTIELATGRINVVCEAAPGFGGSWGADGTIVFSPGDRGVIHRVAASGGAVTAVTTLDKAAGDEAHRWPQLLPDGRHLLYMSWSSTTTVRPIRIGSLDGTAPRTLFEARSAVTVTAAGDYLLYAEDQPARLMARPFDPARLAFTGPAFQAVADDNVSYMWNTGDTMASASAGTLVYTSDRVVHSQLTWFSRLGQPLGTVGERGTYFDPVISRDGTRLAVEKHDFDRGSGDTWTIDLERAIFSRLTSAPGFENVPVWSQDGRRIAYASDQERTARIYVKDASGAGTEEMLVQGRGFPMDWSPDGRHLLFMTEEGKGGIDIFVYDFEQRRARPLLASAFDEEGATFSPDGRWIAYSSTESQQRQVYISSYPDLAIKVAVSTRGGSQPRWRRDGRELFYLAADNTLMAVAIDSRGTDLRASTPQPLFVARVDPTQSIRNSYTVSVDGQRFLINLPVGRNPAPLIAVLNWRSATRK